MQKLVKIRCCLLELRKCRGGYFFAGRVEPIIFLNFSVFFAFWQVGLLLPATGWRIEINYLLTYKKCIKTPTCRPRPTF